MAPVKKPQPSNGKVRKPSSSSTPSKSRSKGKDGKIKRPPPKQVKTKPATPSSLSAKAKKPKYTEAQLNLPAVNSIVPASAATKTGKGTGKKRDKVYVDDTESMMTILAMVNAEKEGQIESKVLRARRMEEIREARKKEAEKRAEGRRGRLEEVKMGLKKKGQGQGKGKGKVGGGEAGEGDKKSAVNGAGEGAGEREGGKAAKKRKSVSFA